MLSSLLTYVVVVLSVYALSQEYPDKVQEIDVAARQLATEEVIDDYGDTSDWSQGLEPYFIPHSKRNNYYKTYVGVQLNSDTEGCDEENWRNCDDVRIHYTLDNVTIPTVDSDFVRPGEWIIIDESTTIKAITFGRKLFPSNMTESTYYLRKAEHGYLVPYHNGDYFGTVVRVELEVVGVKRPQRSKVQEFADFFSTLGKGAYAGQVASLNLTDADDDLKGFQGGFYEYTIFKEVNSTYRRHYGYFVPFHNGDEFFGKVVRLDLERFEWDNCTFLTEPPQPFFYNETLCNKTAEQLAEEAFLEALEDPKPDWYVEVDPCKPFQLKTWDVCVNILDLTLTDDDLRGFRGGFIGNSSNGSYAYMVPSRNGKIPRVPLLDFNVSAVEVVDLTLVDPELTGFHGGFAFDDFAYFVPHRNYWGPVGGVETRHPVDQNSLRSNFMGKVVRVNMSDWSTDSVEVIDLPQLDDDLRGFVGGFASGEYGYLVPYMNDDNNGYFGKVVRFHLKNFTLDSVQVLDLTLQDPDLKGFYGGFVAGWNGYLVPFRNGHDNKHNFGLRGFGKIVTIDLRATNFSQANVSVIDAVNQERVQIPSTADQDLRGFNYGFASGDMGYFLPFYYGIRSGKIGRINTRTFNELQVLDLRQSSTDFVGFGGGFPV